MLRNRKKKRPEDDEGEAARHEHHAIVHHPVGRAPDDARLHGCSSWSSRSGALPPYSGSSTASAPSSNLNDGYPWGVWIAIDVVVGTALGCGGYAVALLVYILNKGEYHPLVRPAMLTSLLGYGLAVLAVTIDLGRFWALWKVPVFFWRWTSSPQLEVALCVAAYVLVLLVELSPALLREVARRAGHAALQELRGEGPALSWTAALLWILALGLLLPTMHQSSLGTMMLLPGPKLHPLWFTPWLPLLFLVNCIIMGYGVVVLESTFSSLALRPAARDRDARPRWRKVAPGSRWFWVAFRVADVALGGELRPASRRGLRGSPSSSRSLLHVAAVAMLALGAAAHTRRAAVPGGDAAGPGRRRSTASTPTSSPSSPARTGPTSRRFPSC